MEMERKTLDVTKWDKSKDNDNAGSFGDPNIWALLNKAWNKTEGWMKSTKCLNVPDLGVLVQVSTHHKGQVAEAVTFVPGAYFCVPENCDPQLLPIKTFDKKEGE